MSFTSTCIPVAIRSVNNAVELDLKGSLKEAYCSYLASIIFIIKSLKDDAWDKEFNYVCNDDTIKLLKLVEQCHGRAVDLVTTFKKQDTQKNVDETSKKVKYAADSKLSLSWPGPQPSPQENKRLEPTSDAVLPRGFPSYNQPVTDSHNMDKLIMSLPTPPKMNNAASTRNNSVRSLDRFRNRQTFQAYQQRKSNSKFADYNLKLLRKTAEDMVIEKARRQALNQKLKERKERLRQKAEKRFADRTGSRTTDAAYQKKIYTRILEFEQETTWPQILRERLTGSSDCTQLINEIICTVLRSKEHPLGQIMAEMQYTLYKEFSLLVSDFQCPKFNFPPYEDHDIDDSTNSKLKESCGGQAIQESVNSTESNSVATSLHKAEILHVNPENEEESECNETDATTQEVMFVRKNDGPQQFYTDNKDDSKQHTMHPSSDENNQNDMNSQQSMLDNKNKATTRTTTDVCESDDSSSEIGNEISADSIRTSPSAFEIAYTEFEDLMLSTLDSEELDLPLMISEYAEPDEEFDSTDELMNEEGPIEEDVCLSDRDKKSKYFMETDNVDSSNPLHDRVSPNGEGNSPSLEDDDEGDLTADSTTNGEYVDDVTADQSDNFVDLDHGTHSLQKSENDLRKGNSGTAVCDHEDVSKDMDMFEDNCQNSEAEPHVLTEKLPTGLGHILDSDSKGNADATRMTDNSHNSESDPNQNENDADNTKVKNLEMINRDGTIIYNDQTASIGNENFEPPVTNPSVDVQSIVNEIMDFESGSKDITEGKNTNESIDIDATSEIVEAEKGIGSEAATNAVDTIAETLANDASTYEAKEADEDEFNEAIADDPNSVIFGEATTDESNDARMTEINTANNASRIKANEADTNEANEASTNEDNEANANEANANEANEATTHEANNTSRIKANEADTNEANEANAKEANEANANEANEATTNEATTTEANETNPNDLSYDLSDVVANNSVPVNETDPICGQDIYNANSSHDAIDETICDANEPESKDVINIRSLDQGEEAANNQNCDTRVKNRSCSEQDSSFNDEKAIDSNDMSSTYSHSMNYDPEQQRRIDSVIKEVHSSLDKLHSLLVLTYEELDMPIGRDQSYATLESLFFKPLWPWLCLLFRKFNNEKEIIMYKVIKQRWKYGTSSFFIRPQFALSDCEVNAENYPYQTAIEELRKITSFSSPLDKLECLVQTTKLICQNVKEYWEKKGNSSPPSVGCDDLLPILTYVVVKAALPQLVSECHAMEEFIHESYLMGEEGYCLTTLATALAYVLNLHGEVLKMT